ncbi:MAG TPA: glucosamine-6-phosphate deaminase [Actinomycetes bacterium]
MEVVIVPGKDEIASLVADAICTLLAATPDTVLGLATGSSPSPVYRELLRRHREGRVSFARARGFLLDEYVGLPAGHPQRYRSVIAEELEHHVDFADGAVQGPDGQAEDLPAACAAYEKAIADAGGVDLQLLGIGTDGHVAFNEPGSSLSSRTRVKTLTAQTRADNARFFDSADEVPRHVLTQGLGTIRDARHLVLVATGPSKASAVAAMVEGPVSALCPASVLQLHPHATVLLDDAAAGELRLADYFRETFAGKPDWQSI